MDLFNKTFFRFAFGFLSIIFVSVAVIIVVNGLEKAHGGGKLCLTDCTQAGTN